MKPPDCIHKDNINNLLLQVAHFVPLEVPLSMNLETTFIRLKLAGFCTITMLDVTCNV